MKKIFISILLLIPIVSFGQKRYSYVTLSNGDLAQGVAIVDSSGTQIIFPQNTDTMLVMPTTPIDYLTKSLIILDHAHHEQHDGNHWYVKGVQELDSGDSLIFCVETDNDTVPHWKWSIYGNGITEFFIWKDATCTGGTSTQAVNNNQQLNYTSVHTFAINPTVSAMGTRIYYSRNGSGTNPASINPSENDAANEIIQNASSQWLYIIKSGTDNNFVDFHGWFYDSDTLFTE